MLLISFWADFNNQHWDLTKQQQGWEYEQEQTGNVGYGSNSRSQGKEQMNWLVIVRIKLDFCWTPPFLPRSTRCWRVWDWIELLHWSKPKLDALCSIYIMYIAKMAKFVIPFPIINELQVVPGIATGLQTGLAWPWPDQAALTGWSVTNSHIQCLTNWKPETTINNIDHMWHCPNPRNISQCWEQRAANPYRKLISDEMKRNEHIIFRYF